MRQSSRLSGFLILTLAAAACQDAGDPISPAPEITASVGGGQSGAQAPDLEALDRAIPGFGGFFLDASGTPTVYLTDVRGRGAAEQALGAWMRSTGINPSQLRVVPAQHAYSQLKQWFESAAPEALAVAGVVYADLQEASNTLEIGVEHSGAGAAVRAAAGRLGIPDAGLTVVQTEPIVRLATLQGKVRPIVGGLQINFPGYLCTLGVNVTAGGQASFITNSHCTNAQGGVQNPTPYWQPLKSVDPVQIGTEVADPTYSSGGSCPSGRVCRWSDASRARYDIAASNFTIGRIAKTQRPKGNNLTIVGNFTITAEDLRTNFTIGETLNKVGRTTGWSQGRVSNTCVTTNVSGTNITQYCQTFVQAKVGAGDSGSPVFDILNGGNVAFAGLLWGGSGSSLFVFSPLANIERAGELGPLTTF